MHFWTNKYCHNVCSWGLCSVFSESLRPVCSPCSSSNLHPVGEWKGLFFYFCNSSRAYSNERYLEPPSTFHFHSEAYFTHPKHSSISHLSHHFSECKSRHNAGLLLKDSVLQCLFMLSLLWYLKASLQKYFTIPKSEWTVLCSENCSVLTRRCRLSSMCTGMQ